MEERVVGRWRSSHSDDGAVLQRHRAQQRDDRGRHVKRQQHPTSLSNRLYSPGPWNRALGRQVQMPLQKPLAHSSQQACEAHGVT